MACLASAGPGLAPLRMHAECRDIAFGAGFREQPHFASVGRTRENPRILPATSGSTCMMVSSGAIRHGLSAWQNAT